MPLVILLGNYFLWHYTLAFVDLFRVLGNIVWFLYHFFSIPELLKTLITPWKRMAEERSHSGFDLEEFFSTFIVNMIMRIVGIFLRLSLIVFGGIAIILTSVLGILIAVVWFFAPILVFVAFVYGVVFLFK